MISITNFKRFILDRSYALNFFIRIMLSSQRRNTRLSRIIARLISNHIQRSFGVHISVDVGAIGQNVKFPHPVGIVIGDGAIIEDGVTILQNVTIGRRNSRDARNPHIKKNASLQAGAVVVGPITIGEGAIVGANSVVLNDVDNDSVVAGVPARPIVRR